MSSFHPVSVTRLYRMIADQIAGKIGAGEFLPGERLPSERELAEQLQVSRPSIREALIALEIGGYVEVRVGTGVFVAHPKLGRQLDEEESHAGVRTSFGDIGPFELVEARILIEPECAALAAQHASEQQLAEIAIASRSMHGSNTPGTHDRGFHVAIAEASGNAALAATVSHLWELRERSAIFSRLEQHFVTRKIWELAEIEHDRLLAAIQARDSVRARQMMASHLLGIRARLQEDFSGDAELSRIERIGA